MFGPDPLTCWRVTLFAKPHLAGSVIAVTQTEQLRFDWGEGRPHEDAPTDDFSLRARKQVSTSAGARHMTVRVVGPVNRATDVDCISGVVASAMPAGDPPCRSPVLHFTLTDEPESRTIELSPDITVELSDRDETIGVEIRHASAFLRDSVLESIKARTLQVLAAQAG